MTDSSEKRPVSSNESNGPNDRYRKVENHPWELLPCRLCGFSAELWQRWVRDDIWCSFGACSNLEDVDGEACIFHLPDSGHFYCERKSEAVRYWNLMMGPRGSNETRASAAMREAGKHVFCGATPNWIDHAGDCDALPCICGLSRWLNANKDLLGITLSPTLEAGVCTCKPVKTNLPHLPPMVIADDKCPVHAQKAIPVDPRNCPQCGPHPNDSSEEHTRKAHTLAGLFDDSVSEEV